MKLQAFLRQKIAEGETQSSISRRVGVSQSTINNYLQGQDTPRTSTLRKFARAYNIRLAELISEKPEEEWETYNLTTDSYTGQIVAHTPPKLSDDEKAILEMLKDDPDLARRVRRFTAFEKSSEVEEAEKKQAP